MITATEIPGCFIIEANSFRDLRGELTVTLDAPFFRRSGLRADFSYDYYSLSHPRVVRGFHYQLPPSEQVKLVYCVHGSVLDAVLDIRTGSPSYGKTIFVPLDPERKKMIYIPEGLAHAFLALGEQDSVMFYHTTFPYSPRHEGGILWSSIQDRWPVNNPVVSEKDLLLPPFENHISPFVFTGVNRLWKKFL